MNNDLKINVSEIIKKAKKTIKNIKVDGITINFPFLNINISANDIDKKIAREIIIKLNDKRVLNSKECCENCIENSLKSLFEIREFLVNKQIEINNFNSILFLLMELMLTGIRSFINFTEELDIKDNRQKYFKSLDILRNHLLKCLDEISKIAEVSCNYGFRYKYIDDWSKEIYIIDN